MTCDAHLVLPAESHMCKRSCKPICIQLWVSHMNASLCSNTVTHGAMLSGSVTEFGEIGRGISHADLSSMCTGFESFQWLLLWLFWIVTFGPWCRKLLLQCAFASVCLLSTAESQTSEHSAAYYKSFHDKDSCDTMMCTMVWASAVNFCLRLRHRMCKWNFRGCNSSQKMPFAARKAGRARLKGPRRRWKHWWHKRFSFSHDKHVRHSLGPVFDMCKRARTFAFQAMHRFLHLTGGLHFLPHHVVSCRCCKRAKARATAGPSDVSPFYGLNRILRGGGGEELPEHLPGSVQRTKKRLC